MRVVWAGVIVVVQPSPRTGWSSPGHDLVLHQVSAWLTGLRQGVQAAPPLPASHLAPPRCPEAAREETETPLPGFYL